MTFLMKPEPFSSEVNRLFNTLLSLPDERTSQRWTPAMDLVEAEDHFVLRADLPGLGEEDVSIEVQNDTLKISGERRDESESRGRGFYRVERSFGTFSRTLTLPKGVDASAVTAGFDRGVLEVRIPKPEQRKPRRIAIRTADGNGSRPETLEGTATDS